MKICNKCKAHLDPEIHFDVSSYGLDGKPRYYSSCTSCRSAAIAKASQIKRYKQNPSRYNICQCGELVAKKYYFCKHCGTSNRL